MTNNIKPEYDKELDPVSYYNKYKFDHAINLYLGKIKCVNKQDEFKYTCKDGVGGFTIIEVERGCLITYNENSFCDLKPNKIYTPFMLLSKYKFRNNHYAAYTYIDRTFLNAHVPYIRVGIDYFKIISKTDRFEIDRKEIKRWSKTEVISDHGKDIINYITKYDGFIMQPDNLDYSSTIGNYYNMYSEFSHVPRKGDWKWIEILLRQVFNGHYEKGLRYMQVLYLKPKQILPILVLGSKERSTGKTTFLNFMAQLFGENYTVITPQEFTSSFNSSYAFCNIIGIEETVDDKTATVNKIKGLSTGKFIPVNQKHIDNYKLPFYGKFIITTNEPEKFLKVDTEEIRFWVHLLEKPKVKNSNIEDDIAKEIPAFLHHLSTMDEITNEQSRMIFRPEELETKALELVKQESHTGLYFDMRANIENWFTENNETELIMHLVDIKETFFSRNSTISTNYIRTVLRNEFKLNAEIKYYYPLGESTGKTSRVYTFLRIDFVDFDNKEAEEIPF
jgi:hypothetical protein